MQRFHHLLVLVVLLISVVVGDSQVCDSRALAFQVFRCCAGKALNEDCCVAVLSCINMDSSSNDPCLCRVEEEHDFVGSALTVGYIAYLYDSCRGRQGLAQKVASACATWTSSRKNLSTPPQKHVKVVP